MDCKCSKAKDDADLSSPETSGFSIITELSERGISRLVPRGAHIITVEEAGSTIRYFQLMIMHELGGRTVGYTGLASAVAGSYVEQEKDEARILSRDASYTPPSKKPEVEQLKACQCGKVSPVVSLLSDEPQEALLAVMKTAMTCLEMEYARYVEGNIPTPDWIANLSNAIDAAKKTTITKVSQTSGNIQTCQGSEVG